MGNRAEITIEDEKGQAHPVALADDCRKAVKVGAALMQNVTGTETAR